MRGRRRSNIKVKTKNIKVFLCDPSFSPFPGVSGFFWDNSLAVVSSVILFPFYACLDILAY